VSRRSGAAAALSRKSFGDVTVDLAARAAEVGGARIDLTAREWALLEAMVLRAGRIVPKAELEKLVLGFDSMVASNSVEVHVSALRRKLGRELIETVRGLGYRIDAKPL
jgi:two-component system OmpR family response regulator